MWNKEDEQGSMPAPTAPQSASPSTTRIGSSVAIRGTVQGAEDLHLEGRVEGEVSAPKNRVVIGKGGRIQANVEANVIEVEGQVVGDLNGGERVVVSATGNVKGNIKAPRVSLENGAQFKGSIDMDPAGSSSATKPAQVERKGPKAAEPAAIATPKANTANS